jgi:hypothetical protein
MKASGLSGIPPGGAAISNKAISNKKGRRPPQAFLPGVPHPPGTGFWLYPSGCRRSGARTTRTVTISLGRARKVREDPSGRRGSWGRSMRSARQAA